MDAGQLDAAARAVASTASRRRVVGVVLGLLGGAAGATPVIEAARRTGAAGKSNKCKKPRRKCSGDCVNTATNKKHCGGCGRRCAAGESCRNGTCVATGTCAATCASGCCANGACQPGTTNAQCGKDGESCTACGAGQACRGQHCCGGNSINCDADEDCCNDWVCRRSNTCCTLNGGSTSTTDPLCCDPRDTLVGSRCCRPLLDTCAAGETCCGGGTCVNEVCCKKLNTICAVDENTCCDGTICGYVRENGMLCCLPNGQRTCSKDKDCCDGVCIGGTCRQCGTLEECPGPEGQIYCCQDGHTCCGDGSCAPPDGECCTNGACGHACNSEGLCQR